jgi:alanine dehydrogenase
VSGLRFFTAAEVEAKLDFAGLAEAIAETLVAAPSAPLRHKHDLGAGDTLLLMPAWSSGEAAALGVKLVTVMPGNRARNLATVNAIYLLFDRASGTPLAVIDGEALTLRRTAAASMLAARLLARPASSHLLVIGTGRLAPYLARAHCAGRDIRRLSIWGRRGEGAQSLAQILRDEGLPAQAVDDLPAAVATADIISCATTATAPILHGDWLSPGSHVDLVGGFRRDMREADDAAIVRSRLYVDTYAGALAEAADIVEPLERGLIERTAIIGELSELVAGKVAARGSDEEITLFKSVGTAVEDLAAARLLLARA